LTYFFDDNQLSYSNNVLKLSPTGLFSGDYLIQYERQILPQLSTEIGLGFWHNSGPLRPYLNYFNLKSTPFPTANFSIKYYSWRSVESIQGPYFGLLYRVRHAKYNKPNNIGITERTTQAIFVITGLQFYIFKRFTLDGLIAFGKADLKIISNNNSRPVFSGQKKLRDYAQINHGSIKIGYHF